MTWSFEIDLAVPDNLKNYQNRMNGVIEPRLVGLDSDFLPQNFTTRGSRMEYVPGDNHKRICDAIRESVSAAIKNISYGIAYKSAGFGPFFYPGTQELEFGAPFLTEQGDVIATIDYKE